MTGGGTPASKISLDMLVPGGIKPTDHVHLVTNDGTCSRCRRNTFDEVPLMMWIGEGHRLLIYCQRCCGEDEEELLEDDY